MASTLVDKRHLAEFKLDLEASWHWGSALPSEDPEAVPFAPAFVDLKPTLYIPVKKRGGNAVHPSLEIHIDLFEAGGRRLNFTVPQLKGAKVEVEVWNRYVSVLETVPRTSLSGELDEDLRCIIRVDADLVKKWLSPDGPLKARINENLFDFKIRIPAIVQDGATIEGWSRNRVYLYCRKAIAFLPGVFGSQFHVKTSDGQLRGFPDFGHLKILSQEIGKLECDNQGKPLLDGYKPALLRLKGQVYDTFDVLHAQRKLNFPIVPEDFLLFELNLFAYDWRGDLTEMASSMVERLKTLQAQLRQRPDTDDQIAVAGHSTGGVIIRRMLAAPEAQSLISHAFFLNVPFRGAPKALSVMLTGCDPPGGGSMIPFITQESLSSIALAAPIVYHLAPSYKYPRKVAAYPSSAGAPASDRESEKAGLIEAAISLGIYPRRKVVDASKATDSASRQTLALGADDWAKYWGELFDWTRTRPLYDSVYSGGGNPFFKWPDSELASRKLGDQSAARIETGWNNPIAQRARSFHEQSEAAAASGQWKEKAFIFYSKIPSSTTGMVILEMASESRHANYIEMFEPPYVMADLFDGSVRAPAPVIEDSSSRVFETWHVEGHTYIKRRWRLMASKVDGDTTVPLVSLLGFGGPAKVFKKLPNDPEHVPAPNSEWLWSRVIDVLQEHDYDQHLNHSADPNTGTE